MSNHNPTITSSNATGSFSENANTTGSNALHNLSGTMNFTDSDHSDSHTTNASLKTAVLSSGSVVPATTLAHLNSAMSSSILTDNNGSGKLKWAFSAEDDDFDFLSKNQSLTITYEVKLNDNHGGTTKKLVTVTITGTDDKPLIDFGTEAIVSEQAGQTLSFVPDIAHIAVHFTDVDLTNTGHTASVTGVSASGATGGLLPGFLGDLELRSFFHIDNVVKASGSSNGTINTTFAAPDLAFDYLSEGEAIDITYTIRLDDHAGGITNQTVVVTVVGSNDGPHFLCGPDTEHLTEGEDVSPSGQLTASGDLAFADIDLSDMHAVSTTVTASRSGGGAVPLSDAELLGAFMTGLDDSTGHLFGEVDWSFGLDNGDVSFLNSGETLTLTYQITLTDDAGATTTQTVTITILGTNDPVVITSGPESASLAEFADTTGSAAQNMSAPGSLAFTDTDLSDTHTVAVAVDSAVWSGGPAVPAATETDLGGALLTTLNDSTGSGSGSVDWTFSIADQDLDFLAVGETLVVTYDVTVSDGPTQATQTVTLTVDGADDATTITSGPGSASLDEFADTTGSSAPNSTTPVPTGTLSFTDVDLSDAHQVTVTLQSAIWSVNVVPDATVNELTSALQTTLNDSTGSGAGGVDWTFSIPDMALDFLGAGDTLTVTYDVAVADGSTSSSQTVTITVNGAMDPLIVNSLTGTATDTAGVDIGQIVAAGNLIVDAGDSAADLGAMLSISDVNGNAGNVGSLVAGTYGDLLVFSDGTYFFLANANLDPFQVGDSAVETFDFTVSDSFGRSEAATLTLNVLGANDRPTIVSANANGSLTEDFGPSVLVNGDFETGDLTGWSASSGNISAEFSGMGGVFGNYTVRLAPGGLSTLSQAVATTTGQTYTLTFYVSGDPESSDNQFTASWDGTPVVVLNDNFSGPTAYSVTLVAADASTLLEFSYFDDGLGMFLDHITLEAESGAATQSTDGSISFADVETADTHTANFVPQNNGYVGAFSLDPVVDGSGSGSVAWHFTVDNADIQFLAAGEVMTQVYTVSVTDDHGEFALQDVTVTINGTNDAPTTVGADHIISNADVNGGISIADWVLTRNDVDPDTIDTLTVNSVSNEVGGDAFFFGGLLWFDDGTLGGSFDYDTSDGMAVSTGTGTVTIENNLATTTTLTGTGGDDIIDARADGTALDGGGGDDILIGNAGSHVLTGGSGDDIFAFQVVPDQGPAPTNVVTDFDNVTDDDMIAISASAFGGGLAAGMDVSPLFESSSGTEFVGTLFHYDTTSDTLYYSSDGTTASALVIVQLQAGVNLTAQDMMIV